MQQGNVASLLVVDSHAFSHSENTHTHTQSQTHTYTHRHMDIYESICTECRRRADLQVQIKASAVVVDSRLTGEADSVGAQKTKSLPYFLT